MEMDINKVALLSRIKLDEEEKVKLQNDLNQILSYVEQLNELDIADVEPTSHVLNLENVYREDKVIQSEAYKEVLKHAPDIHGSYFKVPKVIEGS